MFRILVVDDLQDSANTLALLLDQYGYETRVAYSGAEAILVSTEFRPHVAILDIRMADLDGVQAARMLSSQHSHMRLVAVTGVPLPDWDERLTSAGFDAALQKPVDPNRLIQVMRDLLRPGIPSRAG